MAENNRILFNGTAEQIENTRNKVAAISEPNSTKQYPSVKAMVDYVENKVEAWLPNVSPNGDLSWSKSATDIPPETINIKGPQGVQGIQGASGVYVGSGEMPEGYNVQIDPEGSAYELPVTDQAYDPTSENAQSGIAVAEAIALKNFELLSDITLTEDVNEVCWTQTDSGETLGNYKDFFIYFLGSFTNGATEWFNCRANDGSQYFMHKQFNKSTTLRGFWILIEHIVGTDKIDAQPTSEVYYGATIKKSTFPIEFMSNIYTNDNILIAQGLTGNNKNICSDLSISPLKRSTTQDFTQFKNLYIGQPSTSTSIFATGSRFFLFGRKA